jgi:hypothetical protein
MVANSQALANLQAKLQDLEQFGPMLGLQMLVQLQIGLQKKQHFSNHKRCTYIT